MTLKSKILSQQLFTGLLFSFCLITFADGCFVWNGFERLREPQQKAIIVHDEGVEDLILQVKYEGKAEDFGWIVPVPSMPEIRPLTYSCFYVLEQNPGVMIFESYLDKYKTVNLRERGTFAEGKSSDTKVLEEKTVGIYKTSILKSEDGQSLKAWLEENKYKMPDGAEKVFDHYIQKKWFFVAFRINSSSIDDDKTARLSRGELDPIHLIFKTEKPVYPLYISSLNADKTKLLIFLLSKKLYASEFFAPDENTYKTAEDYVKYLQEQDSMDAGNKLVKDDNPISFYYKEKMNFSLYQDIKRSSEYDWYLVRMSKELENSKLKEDIVFNDNPQLIKDIVEKIFSLQEKKGYDKLLDKLLDNFKDAPEQSLKYRVSNSIDVPPPLSPVLDRKGFKKILAGYLRNPDKKLSRFGFTQQYRVVKNEKVNDDDARMDIESWILDDNVTFTFINFLKLNGFISVFLNISNEKEKEEFRSLLKLHGSSDEMIHYDETPYDYYARRRQEFYELLKNPEDELCKFIYGDNRHGDIWIERRHDGDTPDIAANQFRNISVSEDIRFRSEYFKNDKSKSQESRLKELQRMKDPESFRILRNWLGNENPLIRKLAICIMAQSLFNDGTFIFNTAFDNRKENMEIVRPLLDDPEEECRTFAAFILLYLNDPGMKDFFLKTLRGGLAKDPNELAIPQEVDWQRRKATSFTLSLYGAEINRSPEYARTICELLKVKDRFREINPLYEELILAGVAYFDDPDVRKTLLNERDLYYLMDVKPLVSKAVLEWIDAQLSRKDNPLLRYYRIAFAQNTHMELQESFDEYIKLLNNPNMTLEILNEIISANRSSKLLAIDSRPTLNFILKRQDELYFMFKDKPLDSYEDLLEILTGRSDDNLEERLSILKKALYAIEPNLNASDLKRCYSWRYIYKESIEFVIRSELYTEKEIKNYMSRFPEGDINRIICERIIKDEAHALDEEELGNPDLKEQSMIYNLYATSWRNLQLSSYDEAPKTILKNLSPASEPALLLICMSKFEHNKKMLMGILDQLNSKKELSWKEKLLKSRTEEKLAEINKKLEGFSKDGTFRDEYLVNIMDDRVLLEKAYRYLKSPYHNDSNIQKKITDRLNELNMEEINRKY
ncbi:MAG TPA: hypothetical protein DET40_15680 [Lentisphaeria bacterium]|nr:MAG: hypothetical protein A2X45_14205 [Lentisphaerae bacterium GWF2_50_93]HCE44980.1 hypothetical protein [Lentisphaeria bacterium]